MDERLLGAGFNVDVTTSGKGHKTITLKYVLASKSFVYQLQNQTDTLEKLRALGFTKLVVTDGYDETWHWNL